MITVSMFAKIRQMHFREGVSIRNISRRTGLSRNTVRHWLREPHNSAAVHGRDGGISGAHHWARKLQTMSHTVKLMAPQFVEPYVKCNKNDAADAEAICEAVSRPNMRFVPLKDAKQQAVLAVHRARQGFVIARTARANKIRGLLVDLNRFRARYSERPPMHA